jgi:hypothetical protein
MDHRKEIADYLEENFAWLCSLLKRFPLEVTSNDQTPADSRFRAVIARPGELVILIHQLRSRHVNKEEALNPTLVR